MMHMQINIILKLAMNHNNFDNIILSVVQGTNYIKSNVATMSLFDQLHRLILSQLLGLQVWRHY